MHETDSRSCPPSVAFACTCGACSISSPPPSKSAYTLKLTSLSCLCLHVQSMQHFFASDIKECLKEHEAAWKNVEELKEQNRLLRQRNFELEVCVCMHTFASTCVYVHLRAYHLGAAHVSRGWVGCVWLCVLISKCAVFPLLKAATAYRWHEWKCTQATRPHK